MSIVNILKQVKETPGSNDKKSILEDHKSNDLLKRVLNFLLS